METKKPRHHRLGPAVAAALLVPIFWFGIAACSARDGQAPSRSLGSVADGRLVNGRRLPPAGANFRAYSRLGVNLGRTYVHEAVGDAVVDAYATLSVDRPGLVFVYGETGRRRGGKFSPHRTHQNGLSVDFMVPVRDGKGRSVPLPTTPFNKFGYALEFDEQGRLGDVAIDFEAMAAHLLALERAAVARGTRIEKVILAREYHELLWGAPTGRLLRGAIPDLSGARLRHDDHYHVDFANPNRQDGVPCTGDSE